MRDNHEWTVDQVIFHKGGMDPDLQEITLKGRPEVIGLNCEGINIYASRDWMENGDSPIAWYGFNRELLPSSWALRVIRKLKVVQVDTEAGEITVAGILDSKDFSALYEFSQKES